MQIIRDITVAEEPVELIVTAQEAKDYIRIDAGEGNDFMEALILTAQTRLEKYAGIAFTSRTLQVQAYVDNFIELPYYPIGTITDVDYWDGNGWVPLTLGNGYNVFGLTTKKVEMTAIFNSEFRFDYQCGYATGEVPNIFKTAVLKLVADLYEYRENSVENSKPNSNIMTAYELMKPYKRINYII